MFKSKTKRDAKRVLDKFKEEKPRTTNAEGICHILGIEGTPDGKLSQEGYARICGIMNFLEIKGYIRFSRLYSRSNDAFGKLYAVNKKAYE